MPRSPNTKLGSPASTSPPQAIPLTGQPVAATNCGSVSASRTRSRARPSATVSSATPPSASMSSAFPATPSSLARTARIPMTSTTSSRRPRSWATCWPLTATRSVSPAPCGVRTMSTGTPSSSTISRSSRSAASTLVARPGRPCLTSTMPTASAATSRCQFSTSRAA